MDRLLYVLAGLVPLASGGVLHAQMVAAGQTVYASPSGSDWYSGCLVKDGRSNDSFQVQCGGTVYWVSADRISNMPPMPMADPMRPGKMITPTITPSHTPGATTPNAAVPALAAGRSSRSAGQTGEQSYRQINGGIGPGSYARGATPPAPAGSLRIGHYPCWAGKSPAGFAMNIRSFSAYDDGAGHIGTFRYDPTSGKLTFATGPYAGRASTVYGDGSIGLSQAGRDNFGTQCYRE